MDEKSRWPLTPEIEGKYDKLLETSAGIPGNRRPYFLVWLRSFCDYCIGRHRPISDRQALSDFLEAMVRRGKPGFQIDQARLSVEFYWLHFSPALLKSGGGPGTRGRLNPSSPGGGNVAPPLDHPTASSMAPAPETTSAPDYGLPSGASLPANPSQASRSAFGMGPSEKCAIVSDLDAKADRLKDPSDGLPVGTRDRPQAPIQGERSVGDDPFIPVARESSGRSAQSEATGKVQSPPRRPESKGSGVKEHPRKVRLPVHQEARVEAPGERIRREMDSGDRQGQVDLELDWNHALARLVQEVRIRQYSIKTLRAYQHWIRGFARRFVGVPVAALTSDHARDFLASLATDEIAAAIQNQAFSALRFFYLCVLKADFSGLADTPRAKRRTDVPVVLSRGEALSVLAALEYPYRLVAELLYGCGFRLNETLTLRIQDLDLATGFIRPHNGKGNRSRSVPLPAKSVPGLESHLQAVRRLFDSDRKVGYSGVFLPDPLQRKFPGMAREWPWQWVFPAGKLTVSRSDGTLRRFHLHESGIQKEIKKAAARVGLGKRVTPHTFRHSYATHLLQMGYDIRTVQDLLGHREVTTTMIYTHVLQPAMGRILSPLDM